MLHIGDYGIRGIRESDLKQLLSWRNSERVHSMMLTDHKITWEEHQNWFAKIDRKQPAENLIFTYRGQAAGYIGYSNIDLRNKTCEPGLYIGEPDIAPAEAGIAIAYLSEIYIREVFHIRKIYAFVLTKNKRAIRMHKYLKAVQEGYFKEHVLKDGKYEDVVVFSHFLDGDAKIRRHYVPYLTSR